MTNPFLFSNISALITEVWRGGTSGDGVGVRSRSNKHMNNNNDYNVTEFVLDMIAAAVVISATCFFLIATGVI